MTAELIPDPPEYDPALDNPRGHRFEADPLSLEGDCAFCGLPHPDYGLRDEPVFPDVPQEIPTCPSCSHWAHDKGACRVVMSRWEQRICGCSAVTS